MILNRKVNLIKRILAVTLIALLFIGVFMPVSLAWLKDNSTLNSLMESYVHKAYFESGDGKSAAQFIDGTHGDDQSNCAFEIKYPIQLYYFAWLQYLGYFNTPIDDTTTIDQTYFYLSADLDMSGWTLPPIGTETYPFVGNFDGNGHTITNLTIQNIETSTDEVSTTMNDIPVDNITGVNIVGFFGVVGSIGGDTVCAAVDTNGEYKPSSAKTYTYSSEINEIKNFALLNTTVKTETATSLAGIVAGYVNANAENVRVGNDVDNMSSIIIKNGTDKLDGDLTNNISDYTLVGYVTEEYRDTCDVIFAKVDTPKELNSQFNYTSQGDAASWGGSIDMKDMYNRIKNVRNNVKTIGTGRNNVPHVSYEMWYYDSPTAEKEILDKTEGAAPFDSRISVDANDGSGQYVFSYENNSSSYNYISSTYKDVKIVTRTGETQSAFYIQSGANYLNLNSNRDGVTAGTSQSTATKWVMDSSGHIYTSNQYGTFYLNIDNGLTVGVEADTVWTKNADSLTSNNASLVYSNNQWSAITGYTIRSGSYYLNATGTNSYGTGASKSDYTDANGHTVWLFSNPGNNPSGTISTVINGTTYYLRGQRSGWYNNYTYTLSMSNDSSTSWTNNSGKLTGDNVGIRYNSGWSANSTGNATTLTITNVPASNFMDVSNLTFTDTTSDVYTVNVKNMPSEYSYIPLKASQTSPYTVESGNTGYIIGGSYESTDRKADIRISQYAIRNNISNSYSTSNNNINDKNVYTNNASGRTSINPNDFVKYQASKEQLLEVLSGEDNVYGLHFMNASISKDHLITAPTVLIEGTTYHDYEMPEDCIDFNVHQKGYVNFFAGTYFDGNNSFFSLNKIFRDENNKIIDIKQISQIYKTNKSSDPYIYKYSDGTWSDTLPSNNSLAFDTQWIMSPTGIQSDYLYYFEIPVNEGEYALGSVEGKTGAYLIYLDIAANAQLVDRTTVIENIEETTNTYEFIKGVSFQNSPIPDNNIDPIIPSATATISTGITSANSTVSADDKNITFSSGTVNFIREGITVNGDLEYPDIKDTYVRQSVVKIRRTTYYDYNVAKDIYSVTEVVVQKVDDGAITVTINAWNTGSDWDIEGTGAEQIATMTSGFTPTIGGNTSNVQINDGVNNTLEYSTVDNNVYYYLINVGEIGTQTLRIDRDAFEGNLDISNELYQFSYQYNGTDNPGDVSTIGYDYDCDIAFNINAADPDSGMFTYSNREYDITITPDTVNTVVIKPNTNSNYTVTLTPTPQIE